MPATVSRPTRSHVSDHTRKAPGAPEEGTLRHRRRLVCLACPVVVRNLAAAVLLPRLMRLPPPPAEEENQKDRLATSSAGAVVVVNSEEEGHPSESDTTPRPSLVRPGPHAGTLDGVASNEPAEPLA